LGGGDQVIRGQPQQKVSKIPSQTKKLGVVAQVCHPNYAGGIHRRTNIQEKCRTIRKITKAKRARAVA
jgi:hypothetical protein